MDLWIWDYQNIDEFVSIMLHELSHWALGAKDPNPLNYIVPTITNNPNAVKMLFEKTTLTIINVKGQPPLTVQSPGSYRIDNTGIPMVSPAEDAEVYDYLVYLHKAYDPNAYK